MGFVTQGGTYEAVYQSGVTGLVGIVAMLVNDNDGNTVYGPTNAGISEIGSLGYYVKDVPAPGVAGEQFTVIWSQDGTFDAESNFGEDLYITADDVLNWPSLLPIDGTMGGPCRAWTTEEAVLNCCGTESDTADLVGPILAASQTLYKLSASKYAGTCQQPVRPCGDSGCLGPWGGWGGDGWLGYSLLDGWPTGYYVSSGQRPCGCSALSRVPLAGFATRILEVRIDGQVIDQSGYRLDEHRWLTRLRDENGNRQWWPGCQDIDRDADEEGTFEVTYEYGIDPPVTGQLAATELACAIHQTCAGGGTEAEAEDCPLPNNVIKIERQGLTIEMAPFAAWGQSGGVWRTGLPLVDLFLNTYNPKGRRKRRSTAWSPDIVRMPRTVGEAASS